MADLSAYLSSIMEAPKGEVVRDAIVKALKNLNNEGMRNAATLDHHPPEYFAKYIDVWNKQDKMGLDDKPTEGHNEYGDDGKSGYAVYSGGLYEWFGDWSDKVKEKG